MLIRPISLGAQRGRIPVQHPDGTASLGCVMIDNQPHVTIWTSEPVFMDQQVERFYYCYELMPNEDVEVPEGLKYLGSLSKGNRCLCLFAEI